MEPIHSPSHPKTNSHEQTPINPQSRPSTYRKRDATVRSPSLDQKEAWKRRRSDHHRPVRHNRPASLSRGRKSRFLGKEPPSSQHWRVPALDERMAVETCREGEAVRNKSLELMMATAVLAGVFKGRRRHQYRRGPCEVCGKPNVRAGRETGVYRCAEHLEAKP